MFKQSHAQGGFTILELMIGIAMLAILLAIAVPSFTDFIRTNRLASQTNELITAMNYARSEAYKRGVTVSVCATDAAGACVAGAAWTNGWLVIADIAGSGDGLSTGDPILQRYAAPIGGFTYTSAGSYVGFKPLGLETKAGTTTDFMIFKSGCTQKKQKSHITLATTGRVSLRKEDC